MITPTDPIYELAVQFGIVIMAFGAALGMTTALAGFLLRRRRDEE